jgi:hypothetical protein
MRKAMRFGMAALLSAGLLASAPAAFASNRSGGGGGVTTEGSCSANSTWKLKVSPENGRLQVEFEVDQNVIGDTWKVRLSDNGTTFFRGTAVTSGPSGSFEVRRITNNQAGTDTVTGMAKNVSTGETCMGTASF